MPCKTCQNPDGTPNVKLLREEASCTFGCGHVISYDEMGGICPRCKDHSCNHFDCPDCGAEWEDWDGNWERTPSSQRQHLSS